MRQSSTHSLPPRDQEVSLSSSSRGRHSRKSSTHQTCMVISCVFICFTKGCYRTLQVRWKSDRMCTSCAAGYVAPKQMFTPPATCPDFSFVPTTKKATAMALIAATSAGNNSGTAGGNQPPRSLGCSSLRKNGIASLAKTRYGLSGRLAI